MLFVTFIVVQFDLQFRQRRLKSRVDLNSPGDVFCEFHDRGVIMTLQQTKFEQTRAVGVAEFGLGDFRIELSRSNFVFGVQENVELRIELHRVLDDAETSERAVVKNLKAERHQSFQERQIPQMCDALASLNQNILQSRHNRFNVAVSFPSVHVHDVLVQMRVESRRVDVENFSLSGENCEDGLNAVKLFAVAEINVLDEVIQNFN